jgi:hypothetical protein
MHGPTHAHNKSLAVQCDCIAALFVEPSLEGPTAGPSKDSPVAAALQCNRTAPPRLLMGVRQMLNHAENDGDNKHCERTVFKRTWRGRSTLVRHCAPSTEIETRQSMAASRVTWKIVGVSKQRHQFASLRCVASQVHHRHDDTTMSALLTFAVY